MDCRAVVECNCREFVLEMVPNREIFTLEVCFRRRINEKSIIFSDGHPSYPSAVRNFGSIHEVVNHSIGFKNESGVHTNQVENLWSHLNQDHRSRSGVNHSRINIFTRVYMEKKKSK
jgi:hypothetical protein